MGIWTPVFDYMTLDKLSFFGHRINQIMLPLSLIGILGITQSDPNPKHLSPKLSDVLSSGPLICQHLSIPVGHLHNP